MRMRVLSIVAIVACVGGCADSRAEARRSEAAFGGTIVISASAEPDVLFPPLTMSVQGKQIVDQVFDNLADIGSGLNTVGDEGFRPRLASDWKWSPDSSWIDFKLNPRAQWHDGRPVTAADVAFTFALVKDTALGSPLSSNLDEVDSVTTLDTRTARVWLARHPPDVFFRIATPLAILPAHLLRGISATDLVGSSFARHPVGSGRFRFAGWQQGASVSLVADSANYRGRPRADKAVWVIAQDYNAAALRFVTGAADFLDVVRPEYIDKASTGGRRVDATTPSLNYGYVAFNLRDPSGRRPHPIFSDRSVRRALVMGVDREAMVQNVFDTLGLIAHGPVTRAVATSDTSIGLPFDTVEAARLLDQAGWRREGTGIRKRAGKPLAFALIVPSSSANRMKFAVLLQNQWRRLGADVAIDQMELTTFGDRLEQRKFDAMLNAWQIDPDPASVRDEWTTAEMRKGGSNFVSYSNPMFDAAVDSAAREINPARAVALYRRAYRQLTDDAPALWLYELRNVFGVSRRIQPVGIRADAWWADLAEWRVR
jgi:peptide/nickel transport system substrate-binding protein